MVTKQIAIFLPNKQLSDLCVFGEIEEHDLPVTQENLTRRSKRLETCRQQEKPLF